MISCDLSLGEQLAAKCALGHVVPGVPTVAVVVRGSAYERHLFANARERVLR